MGLTTMSDADLAIPKLVEVRVEIVAVTGSHRLFSMWTGCDWYLMEGQ
jgi:hypothetical protein